jgi:ribonuclease HI
MEKIQIYTDGGCSGNPGPGGWAFVMSKEDREFRASGCDRATTNNRMELLAVIKALEEVRKMPDFQGIKIELYTDSEYVKRGITEWIKNWERNGYKTAAKKPVKNQDLWMTLKDLSDGLALNWNWVKGHAGNRLNEECDGLVQERIAEIKSKLR